MVDHTIKELQPPAYEGIDCQVSGIFTMVYLCVCCYFHAVSTLHIPMCMYAHLAAPTLMPEIQEILGIPNAYSTRIYLK